jgi:FixH
VKALIALVAALALAATAATIWIGTRLFEEKVTPDPYETGLRFDEEQRRAARPDCAISAGACTRPAGQEGTRITLEIAPRPVRAMADLELTVSVEPASAAPGGSGARLDLSMPGMYMGENRLALAPIGGGRFRGRGVIVRCPSGGRTWSAEARVEPPAKGAPLRATFTFDVAN